MKKIESEQFNKIEKNESEIVNPQEYINEYSIYLKKELEQAGFEINIREVIVGDNINMAIEFGKDGRVLGTIKNTFTKDHVILAAIGSEGGSGILEPLYKSESDFFMSKGIVVTGKFTHFATKRMFKNFYTGAICKNEIKGQYRYDPNKIED